MGGRITSRVIVITDSGWHKFTGWCQCMVNDELVVGDEWMVNDCLRNRWKIGFLR